jgi:hypothetical protein
MSSSLSEKVDPSESMSETTTTKFASDIVTDTKSYKLVPLGWWRLLVV